MEWGTEAILAERVGAMLGGGNTAFWTGGGGAIGRNNRNQHIFHEFLPFFFPV
jgi:hypothetical protein